MIDQRGYIWWYEFVFEERRIRESSYSKKQKVAERMESLPVTSPAGSKRV